MKDIRTLDWSAISGSLHTKGFAQIPEVLSHEACKSLIGLYPDDSLYRNVIDMKRYRFGSGEYKYFRYPLPPLIQQLRNDFYAPLAQVANEWVQQLSMPAHFPVEHEELLVTCKAHQQEKPTHLDPPL